MSVRELLFGRPLRTEEEQIEQIGPLAGVPVLGLDALASAYREFYGPFLDCLRKLGDEHPDRPIAVVIPEIVERRWYHFFLWHRATLLKGLLLMRGGPRIVIVTTPWYPKDALRLRDRLDSRKAAGSPAQERPLREAD